MNDSSSRQRKETGQGLVEYALILAFVGIMLVGGTVAVRNATGDAFGNVMCQLDPGGQCHPALNNLNTSNHPNTSNNTSNTANTPTVTATVTAEPVVTETPAPTNNTFYRAINVNGSSITLDGNPWEASTSASNFIVNGLCFCNQLIPLVPDTDAARGEMIRCSRWGINLTATMTNVPNGIYNVFAYFWEDNLTQTFNLTLNGQVVQSSLISGAIGVWRRSGPYSVNVTNGSINLTAAGGDANLSGFEVWNGMGGTDVNTVGTGANLIALPQLIPGGIARQMWTGVGGTSVSNLTSLATYPSNPNSCAVVLNFEIPTNNADNFGVRMVGYLLPTLSGSYRFWIASDDSGELWLSTDRNASNRALIASVNGFTNSREWTKYSSQQSAAINLVGGQAYYIEALVKEGTGGDNLAVAWQGPGMLVPTVIPAINLSATGIPCA
jgi:Flp pilus assembly pilin Flp